jgi:hypothetical protein
MHKRDEGIDSVLGSTAGCSAMALIDELAGAPHSPDLAALRQNLAAGHYAGKPGELSVDLKALWPEGHEAHARAQQLAELAADGGFDDEQRDAATRHGEAEADARAGHPDHPGDSDVPDLDGDEGASTADTEPAAPQG